MSIRPPGQQIPKGMEDIVARGEKLFRGEKVDDKTIVIGAANACISCHMPSLPLYKSSICVRDPRDDVDPSSPHGLTNITGLVVRERSSKQLPIYRRLRGFSTARLPSGSSRIELRMRSTNPGLTSTLSARHFGSRSSRSVAPHPATSST